MLFAGLCGVFGMFALNGLPMPYHPLFNRALLPVTRDKFFLCVEAADPQVRSGWHAAVHGESAAGVDFGGAALIGHANQGS